MRKLLQGSASPQVNLSADEKLQLLNWVYRNAKHHWLSPNGPLRSSQEGGAHVAIIDDVCLSALALISKQHDSKRPVIFRNNLHVSHCSSASINNPRVDVLDFLWSSLKHVDILTYQAPSQIEDPFMPRSKVGYTLASVDK